MRVRTDKTERLLSNKEVVYKDCERLGNGAQVWSIQYPVTTEMLIGKKEPVSVDLSSTSDAYFVKEFDRKDAYLKQMNQFHNHGIRGPTR
jgi:lipopolysaccharide assembly outer membrane protein LptD (OstA)